MSPPTSFNKAKALEEAGRLVSQRKIPQAIKHYLTISEHDPSDLNLVNIIGDLCIRDGNTAEALKQFQKLADAYTHEGFLLKAVAIHKKISKLVPNDVEPLLKLAEHYSTLSLGREAREHYMQALAFCEKQALNHKALEILRKLVKQEPENLAYRVRLGESCVVLGQNGPAAQIYAEIAEIAYKRGELAAVEQPLQRAIQLDRTNVQANLLGVRLALDSRQTGRAKEILQSSLSLRSNPEAASLLIDVHFLEGNIDAASQVVTGAFRGGLETSGILQHYVQSCLSASDPDAALQPIRELAGEVLEPNRAETIREVLRVISEKYPDHLPALELLFRAAERTPGGEDLLKASELLSNAYIRGNQRGKAEDLYRRLLSLEPENGIWQARLNEILQTGSGPQESTGAEAPRGETTKLEEEPENPRIEEALENAAIFARYGLIDKALDELDRAIQSEPENLKLWRQTFEISKQDRPLRAAQAAEVLAGLLLKCGDLEGAKQFEKLAREFPASATNDVPIQSDSPVESSSAPSHFDSPVEPELDRNELEAQPGATWPSSQASSAPPKVQTVPSIPASSMASQRASVSQIDLTEEVEALATIKTGQVEEELTTTADVFAEEQAEIDFYLEYGFFVEAQQAAGALAEKFPNHPGLPALERRVEEATQSGPAAQEEFPESEAEAGPTVTAEEDSARLPAVYEAGRDLEEEQEATPEAQIVEGAEFAITPTSEKLEGKVEPQFTPEPEDWISGSLEEAQPPPSEITPAEEPAHTLDLEWISTEAAPEEETARSSEPEPIPFEPALVQELQPAAEGVAAATEMPSVGEFISIHDVASIVPESPVEEALHSATELTAEPVQEPPQPVPIEQSQTTREVMAAVPEPLLVLEVPPDEDFVSIVSEPSAVEEVLPALEITPTLPEPPHAMGLLSAFGSVHEPVHLEEPPPTLEAIPVPSEPTADERPLPTPEASSTVPGQPSTEEPLSAPGPGHEPIQAEDGSPMPPLPPPLPADEVLLPPPWSQVFSAEELTPIMEAGPEVAVATPGQEPPQIPQQPLDAEQLKEPGTKTGQPANQNEPFTSQDDVPESPASASVNKPTSPVPDHQALIIDSLEEPDAHQAGPEGSDLPVPPPLAQEQSRKQRRLVPQRPAASFNQILQELSGDLVIAESPDSPEKHYNLGLAFREMDLLDEAIGEFQKVVRGSVKGSLPPRFLEACSLLASCFMQKGMPSIAVKWYQRALDVPGIEGDALLALNYDLADSMDRAGQKKTALEKFMEVYSENIDYRDVADRIRTLQHSLT